MCLADSRLFLPGLNLAYTDRCSMAASTEVRVPFVDVEVFRAAFTFPGAAKIGRRAQKMPLRRAARDWLPQQVIDRPKASFGAPLRSWVTRRPRPADRRRAAPRPPGLLRVPAARQPLRRMVTDHRAGRSDQSKQLWQLLSMELWYAGVTDAGVRSPGAPMTPAPR